MTNSSSLGTSWEKKESHVTGRAVPKDALLLLRHSADEGSVRNRIKYNRARLLLQTTTFSQKLKLGIIKVEWTENLLSFLV